jgi:hypothetical protein
MSAEIRLAIERMQKRATWYNHKYCDESDVQGMVRPRILA